jgi:uncharacterized FlgJ-related protein
MKMKSGCCNSKNAMQLGTRAVCLNATCNNYLQETSLHRDRNLVKIPLVISVFAFHLLWPIDDVIQANNSVVPDINHLYLVAELNEESLLQELHKSGVFCATEVFAQMKLESGSFKSSLLLETNNLMGMRFPFSRPTIACGIYLPDQDKIIFETDRDLLRKYAKMNHYAVYSSWQDAVADYKLWQDYNFKGRERYLSFLGSVYAEDSLYISKIKRIASSAQKLNTVPN